MRLIDADHLIQVVCSATILSDGFKEAFRKLVNGEPTVDRPTRSQFKRMAVQPGYEPVVHCKDCKHVMFSDCYGECGAARMGIVGPDDFCSYGERKENDDA